MFVKAGSFCLFLGSVKMHVAFIFSACPALISSGTFMLSGLKLVVAAMAMPVMKGGAGEWARRGERTGPEMRQSEALAMSLMLRERKERQHRPQHCILEASMLQE